MLEELTKEQEELMYVVRDEWLKRLSPESKLDKENATKGLQWLYEFSGLKAPEILFVESPLAAQLAVKKISGEDIGGNWEPFSWFGNVGDYGWASFYDFFTRIGVINNEHFNQFVNLLKSNIYDTIQLDTLCVVVPMPSALCRDEEQRLHSTAGPAIAWKDGYEQFYLWGVFFKKSLWEKVVNKTLSMKELLGLENTEQRMAALKIYGAESCLEAADAKLLNKSERGNELYVLKDLFSEPQYALKYACPSTGRIYVSFVPPEIGIDGNADKAMAWKFQLNLDEYQSLEFEA